MKNLFKTPQEKPADEPPKTPHVDKHFTIDPKYYEGRVFDPVLESQTAPLVGPFQANIGHNGVMCIGFVANAAFPLLSVSAAPYPNTPTTPGGPVENDSQQRIVSISKNKADFSSGARMGSDCGIQAKVGATGRETELYVPLVAGEHYWINYANANPADLGGGNVRIQPSFSK